MCRKVVFLTPVKNEEWILESFLKAASVVADVIVAAYQPSEDRTLELLKRFAKVDIVENESHEYNEKTRAELLVNHARRIYGRENVLVAVDADEIVCASAFDSPEWNKLRQLNAGTSILFEKPDILPGGTRCVRFPDNYRAIGYVDDGIDFDATLIHTQRVPKADACYRSEEIKFLHVNLIRRNALRAKWRMYCALEAVNQTSPWWRRALSYRHDMDFDTAGVIGDLPDSWTAGYAKLDINPLQMNDEPPFWHDFAVLRLFEKYGPDRFRWEDIWQTNWEEIRRVAVAKGIGGMPNFPIKPPSRAQQVLFRGLRGAVERIVAAKRRFV